MKKMTKIWVEKLLFADKPANWFVNAQGFYQAGLRLVNAIPKNQKKMISQQEVFFDAYSYKIAVYLLCHSVELLFKTLVSIHNNVISPNNKIKSPQQYSHGVTEMAKDLTSVDAFSLNNEENELIKYIDEYLAWFGRYYCPKENKIAETINKSFTKPDENEMIGFKYELEYQKTHKKIAKLFVDYSPKSDEATLTMPYFINMP